MSRRMILWSMYLHIIHTDASLQNSQAGKLTQTHTGFAVVVVASVGSQELVK